MNYRDYRISELIDMSMVQKLADSNYKASGVPMTIIDAADASTLVKAGWSDICVKFHRANALSHELCLKSDAYINDRLGAADYYQYKCLNGLWHIAVPLIVSGRHLATLILSQFWYEDEKLEIDRFLEQSATFGYDKEAYFTALKKIPVLSKERVDYMLAYYLAFARFLVDIAEHSIQIIGTRESLMKSEERFRRLIESVTDYIYTVKIENGSAVSTAHGTACIAVTGYSSEEYDANPDLWYQMVHDEDRALVLDRLNRAISGEPVAPLEHRIIHKNGAVRWIRNTIVPVLNENNELTAYDGMIRDITERKRAEFALRESEERYRSFLEDFQGVAFKRTVDLKPVFFHGAIEKITGYTEDDLMSGRIHWRKIAHPDELPALYESIKDLQTIPGHSIEREYRILRKDGQLRWIKELIQNKCDESGRPAFIQGTIYDITVRKKLEEQLQHAQKTEAIGQLAGGVAHDFNNILSAMIGFTTLAQMKMGDEAPARKYLSKIFELSDKATKLTGSLLAFSRKQVINVRPLDLNKIMNNIGMLLARIIGEDIRLEIELADEPITIMTDSGQIEQIMMNLASNSRDSMPQGGSLKISTSIFNMDYEFIRMHGYGKSGRYALIQVQDSGGGMDEKIKDKIFDPFFTTKDVGKGTGLGLAIVYGIVKQHNGYINVYSESGKGTSFKIYLPAMPKPIEETPPAEVPVKGGPETILLAEDEKTARESLRSMLEVYGYAVIEAIDGQDAVDKFSANRDRISLVLLDVIMPVKSGRDAFDEIKAINPGIRVIFTSGYTGDVLQGKGIAENEAYFVAKPVAPKELFSKIRQALDTTQA